MDGGVDVATQVAAEHGFINLGKVRIYISQSVIIVRAAAILLYALLIAAMCLAECCCMITLSVKHLL